MDSRTAQDIRQGLTSHPRTLPAYVFYDAEGSRLFEEICELPEYYLTRAEREILRSNADEMAHRLTDIDHVVELGAGSASKTGVLLRAMAQAQHLVFHPIDVSREALRMARESMSRLIPSLEVDPIEAQYGAALKKVEGLRGRRLVMFIGSSLGNFEPGGAASMLDQIRASLRTDDALLIGTDLPKDQGLLVPAYDDRSGVTAAFNRNALTRINRELGGNFDLARFRHRAVWNERESRMEMHLESTARQDVEIQALELKLSFQAGERIHTENSYKFAPETVQQMLKKARFEIEAVWRDRHGWFADWLARAT